MSFNGSIINQSATRSFIVGTELTGAAFRAIKLTADGAATAGAGDIPVGILTAEHELPLTKGIDVTAAIKDVTLWQVGESVTAGDLLTSGDDGVAMKATSGKFIFAQALQNGANGSAVSVQIIKAGYSA